MALADSRWQRTVTLCALYVAQGVPWGFMLIALPAHLSHEYHIDDAGIGRLTGMILIPWSFKLVWAPLMDSFTIPSMGRRRPWIIGAELMMALTLLGFVGLGDLSEKLQLIVWMYFLHNCFASLQDVCTDALAVDILPPQEQGLTNGMMWGSKLIGKGIGAWGLSMVLGSDWGLEGCVAVQILLLVGIVSIPIFFLERRGEKRFPWSSGRASPAAGPRAGAPGDVFRAALRAFSLTTTAVFIVFTLTKLIGTGIYEVVTNTLTTQKLNPVWTAEEYAKVMGLTTFAVIPATLLGGYLGDRFGRRLILIVGFLYEWRKGVLKWT